MENTAYSFVDSPKRKEVKRILRDPVQGSATKGKTRINPFLGFPCWPVVRNLPCNAGDMGLIPGQGTKILQAVRQQSL